MESGLSWGNGTRRYSLILMRFDVSALLLQLLCIDFVSECLVTGFSLVATAQIQARHLAEC